MLNLENVCLQILAPHHIDIYTSRSVCRRSRGISIYLFIYVYIVSILYSTSIKAHCTLSSKAIRQSTRSTSFPHLPEEMAPESGPNRSRTLYLVLVRLLLFPRYVHKTLPRFAISTGNSRPYRLLYYAYIS